MSYREENFYSNGRRKIKNTKKLQETTRDRHLFWINYYTSKNFGLWIECTKCKKWRKSLQYNESHEVPADWHCSMNISENGNVGSCEEPEEPNEEGFVEYSPGSIVWAKLDGYPWWPGMVDEDPDVEDYYWKTRKHTYYNVTFLDEHVTRAWVPAYKICPFSNNPNKFQYANKKKNKYKASINKAEERANEALKMTMKDRLKRFSFATLFQGKWPRAVDFTEEIVNTEDITDTLLREIDLLDSEKSDFEVDCRQDKVSNKLNVLDTDKKNESSSNKSVKLETGKSNEQKNHNLCIEDEDTLQLEIGNTSSDNGHIKSSVSETIEEVIKNFVFDDGSLKIQVPEGQYLAKHKSEIIKTDVTFESKSDSIKMKQNKRKFENLESDSFKNIAQNSYSKNDSSFVNKFESINETKGEDKVGMTTVNNTLRKEKVTKYEAKKLKSNNSAENSGKHNICIENNQNENSSKNKNLKTNFLDNTKPNIIKEVKVAKGNEDPNKTDTNCIKEEKTVNNIKDSNFSDLLNHETNLNEKSKVHKSHGHTLSKINSKSKPVFKAFKKPLKGSQELHPGSSSADPDKIIKPVALQNSVTYNGTEQTHTSTFESRLIKSSSYLQNENVEIKVHEEKLNSDTQAEITLIENKEMKKLQLNKERRNKTSSKSMNSDKIHKKSLLLKQPLVAKSHANGFTENIKNKNPNLKNVKCSKMKKDTKFTHKKENNDAQINKIKDFNDTKSKCEVITIEDNDFECKKEGENLSEIDNCFVIAVSDEEVES